MHMRCWLPVEIFITEPSLVNYVSEIQNISSLVQNENRRITFIKYIYIHSYKYLNCRDPLKSIYFN